MFERYTEKARRVIFFARYEASQFGTPYIQSEHLLLGILREDKDLMNRFLLSPAAADSIRGQIEARTPAGEKASTSVDLPLDTGCKRILAYGAEEAERLKHKHISPEHLLLGLLREETSFAAEILHERGLRLSVVREEIARSHSETPPPPEPRGTALLAQFGRDWTAVAVDGGLHPAVARDQELQLVMETLCRHAGNNPMLIGEPAATRSVVETLAQRIAKGVAPAYLAEKRIVAVDFPPAAEHGDVHRGHHGTVCILVVRGPAGRLRCNEASLVGWNRAVYRGRAIDGLPQRDARSRRPAEVLPRDSGCASH